MKRIKNILKNKELDIVLLIVVLVSSASLFVLINPYDELWNFANSYKIFNGFKPYEDLNIIVTPLFFYLSQIFFEIFGPSMMSFRIYNIIISSTFLILIYFIFRNLKVVRRRSIFYTVLIDIILNSMIAGGANYNIFSLIPVFVGVILVLTKKDKPILLGVLLYLTFMLKQNIYIYFALGILCYKLINNKDIRRTLWELFRIYFYSVLGIIAFFIYLYIDNNLYNFINSCFLGINEFQAENIVFNFWDARYLYISIIVIIFILWIINNKKINKDIEVQIIKNIKNLLCFAIPLLLISYPIANYYHVTLGSVLIIVVFLYAIENILISEMQIDRKKEKRVYSLFVILYILYFYIYIAIFRYGLIDIVAKDNVFSSYETFKGIKIEEQQEKNIHIVCDYIKEQEENKINVKILSYKANLYMIQLNKNNKMFDLAFLGNMGKQGEKALIDEIKKMKNTYILIETDPEKVFEQESKLARKYIINTYEKIGEIEEYSIYKVGF